MLVLARKKGQGIKIGDDILIRVTEVRGSGARALVKLGIEAPSGTKILREEVELEIAEEMMLAKDPSFDIKTLRAKVKGEEP